MLEGNVVEIIIKVVAFVLGMALFIAVILMGYMQIFEWHNSLEAKIEPNPQLDKYQKTLIERDYCMEDGYVIISLKAAFFYYFKLNFGFVEGYEKLPPTRQQVVPVNLEELETQAALLKSMAEKQTLKLSDDLFFV